MICFTFAILQAVAQSADEAGQERGVADGAQHADGLDKFVAFQRRDTALTDGAAHIDGDGGRLRQRGGGELTVIGLGVLRRELVLARRAVGVSGGLFDVRVPEEVPLDTLLPVRLSEVLPDGTLVGVPR